MKRLRSSDDLDSYGEKNVGKESLGINRSSSSAHRGGGGGFYHKSSADSNVVRKGLISSSTSSSSRYDRDRSSFLPEDDGGNRETSRPLSRKRLDHDFEGFDRRKGFDNRYRDERIHRSESFCVSRREFPKGFRSDRERPRREGSVSSWRRFGSGVKDFGLEERERGSVRPRERERKDVKSPSWSKDSGSEQSRMRGGMGVDSRDSRSKSKSKSRSSRSPTCSKDSGSEQSKSVGEVIKKNVEDAQVQSGSNSEMEEGELQPEPQAETKMDTAVECGDEGKKPPVIGSDGYQRESKIENTCREIVLLCGFDGDRRGSNVERASKEVENEDADQMMEGAEKEDNKGSASEGKHVVKDVDELVDGDEKPSDNDRAGGNGDAIRNGSDDEGQKATECVRENGECKVEESIDIVVETPAQLEKDQVQDKGIDLEVKAEEVEGSELNKEFDQENGGPEVNMDVTEGLSQNIRDKGKSIAVAPSHVADSSEDGLWMERESRNLLTCRDGNDDFEGPSTRGFELFSSSPVRRVEKAEHSGANKQIDEKLGLELLDLSLSLPNVLLPIGSRGTNLAPGSPSRGRSVQSFTNTFCTNSDGFTASMSFSGSQSFYHNPSCSLTQNSLDNFEQSVHSRPIFQGVDQVSQGSFQAQSHNESRHKEVPMYQRILMNGNGSLHQSQALQCISNGQNAQGQHIRVVEGSSKVTNGLDKQLSFHEQNDVRSPPQSVGSHEIGSNFSFDKKRAIREKHGGSLYRSSSQKEQDQLLIGGADFVETVICRMISDPIHLMAKKFHEMTGQSIGCLKESIREIMVNVDKHAQLYGFQNALQNKSDITLEMLVKSHRAQLEILVALRTGLPDFLRLENSISSSELAEIFLNLRCRNLMCRSLLPVDECDCKVCARRNGFCSACMCLVCSKFDMASNTCSWVGCDVCLHWCHADCGLRDRYIRNGRSATGPHGTTEMQFHCVACDHPSEMFGFVKEVFQNFAKEWTRETLSKELEYVRRIFSGSKDLRGKRLHEIADLMLARLANKAELSEVYNHVMDFLAECDSSKFVNAPASSGKEQGKPSNGIAGASQDTSWRNSVYPDKAPQLEGSSSMRRSFNECTDKHPVDLELERNAHKEPLFDELESIVRIKQAEAKMFQSRADDARREAEGLKRIANAKAEKIEEEYRSRITKLRLVEAEEMRRQKLEEYQSLERAQREYFSMKMRMEEDIKDLLLKMETTKRNLAL